MEHQSEKHINLDYLKELSNGSNSFIVEMIDAFLEQTPEEISNLEKYLSANNFRALRGTANKIKPSFTFMGIKELVGVIKQVEEYAAKEISLEQLPGMIKTIKDVCELAIDELLEEKKHFS